MIDLQRRHFDFKKMNFPQIFSPMRLVLLLLLHTWSYTYLSTNALTTSASSTSTTNNTSSASVNTTSTSNISTTPLTTVGTSTTTQTTSTTPGDTTVSKPSATTKTTATTTTSPTSINTNTATTESTTQPNSSNSSQTNTTTVRTSSATDTEAITTTIISTTTDIDECNDNSTCDADANCTNAHGSFICTCKPGFSGNGTYCTDIDECYGNHTCHDGAYCNNTQGGYKCICETGFTGNDPNCTDIDECNNSSTCHADANCTNTHGSFNCTCRPGFTGNGTNCTDINECNDNSTCDVDANCTNTNGSFKCTCRTGFTGNGTYCTDVDECENKTICNDFTKYCVNTNGNYSCKCKPAYYLDEETNSCQLAKFSYVGDVKIDAKTTNRTELLKALRDWLNSTVFKNLSSSIEYIEILTTNDTTNTISRAKRQTVPGKPENFTYILHTKGEIRHEYLQSLINECNSNCLNASGKNLFTVSDGGIDIAKDSALCKLRGDCDPFTTECNDTNGRPECRCKTGFERKPNQFSETFCTDTNECEHAHQSCINAANCTNTHGDWKCICKDGFEETKLNSSTRTCSDKCIPNPCQNGAKCEHGNGIGLFYCRCPSNWIGPYCEDSNPQTLPQDTSEESKYRTILIAVGASLGSICFLLLIVTCRVCRRKQSGKHPELRPLSTHMNDYEMNENKGTYQIPRAHVSNGDDRPSKMEDKQSTHQIPLAHVGNRDERLYDEIEGGRELNVLDERSIKQDKLEREPLTKSIKESHGGGAENRSFLHEEAERRRSQNPGKSGVDYF